MGGDGDRVSGGVGMGPERRLAAGVFLQALKDLRRWDPDLAKRAQRLLKHGKRREDGSIFPDEYLRYGVPQVHMRDLAMYANDPRDFLVNPSVFHDILEIDPEVCRELIDSPERLEAVFRGVDGLNGNAPL